MCRVLFGAPLCGEPGILLFPGSVASDCGRGFAGDSSSAARSVPRRRSGNPVRSIRDVCLDLCCAVSPGGGTNHSPYQAGRPGRQAHRSCLPVPLQRVAIRPQRKASFSRHLPAEPHFHHGPLLHGFLLPAVPRHRGLFSRRGAQNPDGPDLPSLLRTHTRELRPRRAFFLFRHGRHHSLRLGCSLQPPLENFDPLSACSAGARLSWPRSPQRHGTRFPAQGSGRERSSLSTKT